MKPLNIERYRHSEMIRDALLMLTPAILTLGLVWFFWYELPLP